MTTRCKQGDLAVIVGCRNGQSRDSIGLIVEVLEFAPLGLQRTPDGIQYLVRQVAWLVRSPSKNLTTTNGSNQEFGFWGDIRLCPIRDNPGEDETLSWTLVPTKEIA